SMKLPISIAVLALVAGPAAAQAAEFKLPDYEPVTEERMKSPEPENWLLTKGNYEGWSYTPLDQITTENVSKLKPVWAGATGVTSGHEAPAIVDGEYMFVATPHNQVLAFHATSGRLLWRYQRETPEGLGALPRT